MKKLSASALADLAGVTEVEVARLVELGILVARDGAGQIARFGRSGTPPRNHRTSDCKASANGPLPATSTRFGNYGEATQPVPGC